MNDQMTGRRNAHPIRMSVARELGRLIDGAWWPRAERLNHELPQMVSVLTPILGDVGSIDLNWSPLQRPPELNWPGWERRRQHVMSIKGRLACANLLIVPYATNRVLAVMVMRRAADMPIAPADQARAAFATAGLILRAAEKQRDVSYP